MHLAEDGREDRAGHDAEQHGDVGKETLAVLGDRQDDQQHEQRDAEPVERAVVRIGKLSHLAVDLPGERRQAAARPVDADAHQRDADHDDDGAGHHRRKQRQHSADERRDHDAEDAGHDHRTVDAEQADLGIARHGEHRRHRGEGDAHHHRQPDADAREADRLDQGGDAAGEQVGVDQHGDLLRRQAECPADDQRHRHRARVHHQHMLQAKREQARIGQNFVYRVCRLWHVSPLVARAGSTGGMCLEI